MNIYQSLAIIVTLLGYCQGQKLANIDYLGTGYDIISGNPHNHLYDPGKINLLNLANYSKFLGIQFVTALRRPSFVTKNCLILATFNQALTSPKTGTKSQDKTSLVHVSQFSRFSRFSSLI